MKMVFIKYAVNCHKNSSKHILIGYLLPIWWNFSLPVALEMTPGAKHARTWPAFVWLNRLAVVAVGWAFAAAGFQTWDWAWVTVANFASGHWGSGGLC